MRLILFDIDGTLIDSGEAGTRSLNLAFEEVLAVKHAFGGISMAGKTDIQIIREALDKFGFKTEEKTVGQILKAYTAHLLVEMNNDRKHIKPGINDILERLSGKRNCVIGLLTGNIEDGAKIKLDAFGLTGYFNLSNDLQDFSSHEGSDAEPPPLSLMPFGAFGSDNEDRNKLLPIAVSRFKAFSGRTVAYEDCVVIGDTPFDVQCAKPYGATVVAVATGPYPAEHLRMTEADMVLGSLSDSEAFMGLIC